jgi:sensor histidine kinase regulating citrate/malate metabolism
MSKYQLKKDENDRTVLFKDGEVVDNIVSVRVDADHNGAVMYIKQYNPDLDFTAEGRVYTDKYVDSLKAVADKAIEYMKQHRGGIVLPDNTEKELLREELKHKLYDAGYAWEDWC